MPVPCAGMKFMTKNIIEIINLNKSFGDNEVLSNINLEIKQGEFLTFLGPSGCGKSTLLRLISGLEELSSGDIFINGKNMKYTPAHMRHVNMVFQSYALFPHMTVFENVAFGLRCKKVPSHEINERVEQALRMVKLEPLRARKPNQLSGGQQQRVAIARAVVNQPLVLLLDEPLSALDSSLRKDMQIELKSLQRRLGITFIMVTHDQQEALSISDRVVVMADGCIEQVGTPRQVYERPNNLYVAKFIGAANIFNALVTEYNDNHVKVLLEHKEFKLKTDRHFTEGQYVAVVIRPEDLKTWDRSEVDDVSNMIPLIVEQVIYKGTTVDLILRTESGMQLSATEFFDEDDEELDFKIGERVWGEWHLGWEVVLPNDAL